MPETRVLLVDDEADFRAALLKRLGRRGLCVDEAPGGEIALEKTAQTPFDVVVLDVKMPGLSGLETLKLIKERLPKTEVILLTGQASAQDGVEGIKSGAFDYLTKPVEFEHLLSKINQAAEKIRRAEEKALEAQAKARLEQRLAAAERLASLGTLAAGVAHEINNPLAVIAEAAGWLKSKVGRENELSANLRAGFDLALGKIETSVDRARRITHQLLGFARRPEPAAREFNLADLLWEVAELLRKQASEKDVRLEIEAAQKPVPLWSDPFQLRQVVLNLTTNAIQAVDKGGTVRLRLENDPAGDKVTILIADDGPGIPPENLEKIFQPFFSTKPPGQGTGLGLFVSRGIVDKLGGVIEVESKIGRGAAFKVVLPRRKECVPFCEPQAARPAPQL